MIKTLIIELLGLNVSYNQPILNNNSSYLVYSYMYCYSICLRKIEKETKPKILSLNLLCRLLPVLYCMQQKKTAASYVIFKHIISVGFYFDNEGTCCYLAQCSQYKLINKMPPCQARLNTYQIVNNLMYPEAEVITGTDIRY